MIKNISIISSTRADYGILRNLIFKLQKDKKINLNFYITGSHLLKNFGSTIKEIKKDKIKIKKKIKLKFSNDTALEISKATTECIKKFANEFYKSKPHLIIILGDRYEIFGVAIAAMFCRIPIAHIHGGESTEGNMDEGIRHAITKISHLHFVSTNKYYNRLVSMGEKKKFIYNVGSLGVENVKSFNFLSKEQLEKKLKLNFKKKIFVITVHPETLKPESEIKKNILIILKALKKFNDKILIFTKSGADIGYKIIDKEIKNFCKKNKNSFYFKSLGQEVYFSICKIADCVIGNSSSGIIEIPSLSVPTVDIGERQKGRTRGNSVLNTKIDVKSIINSIKKALFIKNLLNNNKFKVINPYEKKNTKTNICKILKKIKTKNILIKSFQDVNLNNT